MTGNGKNSYVNITKAVTQNYKEGRNDEYITPGLIKNDGKVTLITKNDAVIFFNIREDRARELTKFFVDKNFRNFLWKPKQLDDLYFATFINYQKDLHAKVVFADINYPNDLSEVMSKTNLKQLKVAESQKYAHVTYFFNGGNEEPYPGEERKIISSLDNITYDEAPEMSAKPVCDAVINGINQHKFSLIVVNFANIDMVAHTGNIIATGKAVQIVDELVGKIVTANLKVQGTTIITADHGNAEQMVQLKRNLNNEKETMHTLNPVPFILVTPDNKKNLMQSALTQQTNSLSKIISAKNTLADIAPTILELMRIPKPREMSGHSLIGKLE